MIIQLEKAVTEKQVAEITKVMTEAGYRHSTVKTFSGMYLIGIGKAEIDIRRMGVLQGVKDIHRVTDAYKLVSRKWKVACTQIDLGDGIIIGDGAVTLMAGPCSVESEAQVEAVVGHLCAEGIKIMRGGVFKPRSSPYDFRGLGIEGLKMFSAICKKKGLKIITEVMEVGQISQMADYIDIFQVGARNAQNFNLLDALGEIDKPVLIKRGLSGTIVELLQSAEYIFSAGNERLILCERGIRTYENAYRNTFDLNAIQVLKEKSHLPVVADPSHGVGIRDYVVKTALAAAIAGADGILYEVHEVPEEAKSDGLQTLNFKESRELCRKIKRLMEAGIR